MHTLDGRHHTRRLLKERRGQHLSEMRHKRAKNSRAFGYVSIRQVGAMMCSGLKILFDCGDPVALARRVQNRSSAKYHIN
jgi:hypothetical protein